MLLIFKKFLLLLFCSVFANVIANTNEDIDVKTVTPKELKDSLSKEDCILLDVRNTDEFLAEHIAGAKNIPLPILGLDQFTNSVNKKIIVQCKSGKRGEKAYKLLKIKYPDASIYNLKGGITEWQKENLPTLKTEQPISIMRQTQIIAGSVVICGIIAGITISSAFLVVPILVGSGLIFAGITEWCGMAKLLALMPWN